ncbi:MAG: hypothetical protein QM730_22245 [Anaerolineales bacterium]
MKQKIFQWLGIILILETGLIHYFTAQSQYDKAGYMGYAYVAFSLVTLISAFGIYHRQIWGWGIGLVLSVLSVITFFWSRTLGLPAMPVGEWLAPFDIVAVSVEIVFILLYFLQPWKTQEAEFVLSSNSRLRYILPVTGLFLMVSLSAGTYSWNSVVAQAYGHHVGSVDQVCSTPLTSFSELEDRYGIEVSRIATSMMGSVVDVRLKIVDPEKAQLLLKNQAALLVNQQFLVLAPHMHRHGMLHKNKIQVIFFSTQNELIQSGAEVSLVFGGVRVEPKTVQ